jgi:hypothetical protein
VYVRDKFGSGKKLLNKRLETDWRREAKMNDEIIR